MEYYIAGKKGKSYFQFNESVANLNVGVAERLIDLFTAGGFYFVYDYLHRHFALFDIKPTFLLWVALLLATDLLRYWYHRFGHEVNIFWAAHIVHHQSEDFNLTTGARITIFQAIVRTGFWSILPVIGFPADMITSILIVHGLYPFFTHTKLVDKLGILEYFFVTPSHHRIHHASNEIYLDKNYGDMFIIWDKLFGTFAKETEPPIYGLTQPLQSYSFMWQHFHYFVELTYAFKQRKGFRNKLNVLFGRPEGIDPSGRPAVEKLFLSQRKVQAYSHRLRGYVIVRMVFALVILFLLLLLEHYVPIWLQTVVAFFIVITLINSGAILEQRRWVFYLEYLRASLPGGVAYYYYPNPTVLLLFTGILIGSLWYKKPIQKQYLRLIYG
ncbi:sterol desaturase family protein [Runella slithyformis]|nr:sterol desaturase family protein [Runella slithyformis]